MKFDARAFEDVRRNTLLSMCFSKEKYTKEQVIESFTRIWEESVLGECPKYVLECTNVEAVPFSEQYVFRMPTIDDIKESIVYYNPAKQNYYSDPRRAPRNGFKTWAIYFDDIKIVKDTNNVIHKM